MSNTRIDYKEINRVFQEADCLYTGSQVQSALDDMAEQITQHHQTDNPVILCVLTGAIIPMGHLLTRLNFPLQIDYIHATRYRGKTRGGDIKWIIEPSIELSGRVVLILDDILDEGHTLAALVDYCKARNCEQVKTIVLAEKLHDRKHGIMADYVGLQIEDRYVFGYGMDYKSYLRNADGIYAVKGL